MASQTGRNTSVSYKSQPTLGTPVSGSGATAFRFNPGGGLVLAKNKIRSNENRSDGMSTLGRHGSRSVSGSYAADGSIGTFDPLIEALMRGTFSSVLVVTEATAGLTSITTTTNTIVASAGSFITAGLKKGDTIVLTNHSTAGNNSKNLRIVDLAALTITLPAGSLTANAVADTTFTITRAKKLVNGTTNRYFTFEEREEDQDASSLFPDCRVSSLRLTMGADAMVGMEFGVVGRDMQVLEGAASPNFTSPTQSSSVGLVVTDATIRLGATDIASLTSFDAMFDIGARGQPVMGSNISPDVYVGNMAPITGTITGIRDDMTLLKSFLNEDQLSMQILMTEPDVEPKDYLALYLPLLTLDGNTKGFGADGPLIQTIPYEAGKLLTGSNADQVMAMWQTSAP